MRLGFFCAISLYLCIPSFAVAQSISRPEVAPLIDQGSCDAAADAYRDLYGGTLSQRAEVDLAMCYEQTDRYAEALSYADAAIERDPYSWQWADLAYLTKARACSAIGCSVDARDAISTLRARFPDALATAEADEVEADLDGLDRGQALAGIQTELAARDVHLQAVAAVRVEDYGRALGLFNSVIFDYPDTHQALRSMKVRALLLGLMHDSNGAMEAWQEIAASLEPESTDSALYYEAIYRIALLYQGSDRRDLALVEYDYLVANARDPKIAAKALWQRVGAQFEVYQRMIERGEPVSWAQWNELRRMCRALRRHPGARRLFIVRAELMELESYHWEGLYRLALHRSEEFVAKYDRDTDLLPDAAKAHQVLGESLIRARRHEEALEHFQWIIDQCNGREPWHGIETLARARYGVFAALCFVHADPEEIGQAAEYVLNHHADTEYADLVRSAATQGFWTP